MDNINERILKFVEATLTSDPTIINDLVEMLFQQTNDEINIQTILTQLSLSHTLHYYLGELLQLAKTKNVSPKTLADLIDITFYVLVKSKKQESKIIPVWTGPSFSTSPIRNKSYETIYNMFSSAQREIIIVGYTFSLDNDIVNSLVRELILASERGCRINIIFHKNTTNKKRILNSWPNNIRLPNLYYWKGNEKTYTSLHSKLICIDQKQLLVTSANFTLNGLDRNIETGVLIENDRSVQIIWEQFRSLLNNKEIIKV